MAKTLVIGASGKVGRIAVPKLVALGIPVAALVRDRNKTDFSKRVEVLEGDLETDISWAMAGCDRVIFTAGSGGGTGYDKTLLIDLWGACKAVDAAKESGIEHFVMVSSRGADDPDRGPDIIKPYLVAKHFADDYLMRSGLGYTILRPGRLTDEKGTGLIKTQRPEDPNQQFISRDDTASVIGHCLTHPSVLGKTYELYEGTRTIKTAIV